VAFVDWLSDPLLCVHDLAMLTSMRMKRSDTHRDATWIHDVDGSRHGIGSDGHGGDAPRYHRLHAPRIRRHRARHRHGVSDSKVP
jgi:hypothetical protein